MAIQRITKTQLKKIISEAVKKQLLEQGGNLDKDAMSLEEAAHEAAVVAIVSLSDSGWADDYVFSRIKQAIINYYQGR
jgi:hypothetical protein